MKKKSFNYNIDDSQGTAVEPISMDSSDLWLKLVLKNMNWQNR